MFFITSLIDLMQWFLYQEVCRQFYGKSFMVKWSSIWTWFLVVWMWIFVPSLCGCCPYPSPPLGLFSFSYLPEWCLSLARVNLCSLFPDLHCGGLVQVFLVTPEVAACLQCVYHVVIWNGHIYIWTIYCMSIYWSILYTQPHFFKWCLNYMPVF